MISRANTVNLSNMPVESEMVYSTGINTSDDSLASSLAVLHIGEVNDQWKITRFEKSPPVRVALISIVQSDTRFRCLLI
jgi:aminopeptidase 2